jgi:hypothetical protein
VRLTAQLNDAVSALELIARGHGGLSLRAIIRGRAQAATAGPA